MGKKLPLALITSHRLEKPETHTFGVCMRSHALSKEQRTRLAEALVREFGSIAQAEQIKVVPYKNKSVNTIAYVRVSAARVTPQHLAALCRRLGNLLVKLGIALEATTASALMPPPPNLRLV